MFFFFLSFRIEAPIYTRVEAADGQGQKLIIKPEVKTNKTIFCFLFFWTANIPSTLNVCVAFKFVQEKNLFAFADWPSTSTLCCSCLTKHYIWQGEIYFCYFYSWLITSTVVKKNKKPKSILSHKSFDFSSERMFLLLIDLKKVFSLIWFPKRFS